MALRLPTYIVHKRVYIFSPSDQSENRDAQRTDVIRKNAHIQMRNVGLVSPSEINVAAER